MKSLFLAVIVTAIFSTNGLFGQSKSVTDTISVAGKCEMCKSRIETAAKIKGVTEAVWSPETGKLIVKYNSSETTVDEIQKKVAAIGHDTEKYKADDKSYNILPGCCKYKRKGKANDKCC